LTRSPEWAASTTSRTSSASVVGRRIEMGAQAWFPAQFVQEVRFRMLTPRT
jgi:hypothetical protein